ncbi:MAG: hypothetical protein GY859_20055, partial [Desulfobacterales bacterium]|nr:hypothetical protein [Desulfobacterales bacterium]
EQGARREAAQKALAELTSQADLISTQVNLADETATTAETGMTEIVERTGDMQKMTGLQAERSQRLVELSSSTAEGARQTVEGAGVVVSITEELQKLSDILNERVADFKITAEEERG